MIRIEEATKQIREALWMAYCSGRANNKYIPEEVLPDLLKRCQLFPPTPYHLGAREKALLTENEIWEAIKKPTDYKAQTMNLILAKKPITEPKPIPIRDEYHIVANTATDKALALLPSIEEARRQGLEELRDKITELNKKLDDREADLLEAKREERERIISEIENKNLVENVTILNMELPLAEEPRFEILLTPETWQALKGGE